MKERVLGTLSQIHRALIYAHDVPDIEFSIRVADMLYERSLKAMAEQPQEPPRTNPAIWTYTRGLRDPTTESTWLVPDFNFWFWGAMGTTYSVFRNQINEEKVSEKIPQMVWRGYVSSNREVREPLIQRSQGKSWSNVSETGWESGRSADGGESTYISMADQCHFAMNVHTEGRSWSGRLKYLLNCYAITFVHELEWTTFYYHLLESDGPDQNHVAVKRDFSDLDARVEEVLANSKKAQKVADNAVEVFRNRYLTPAAETCYWRHLFKSYSRVSFTPSEDEKGIAFEAFV